MASSLRIVLLRPRVSENVGAVARALKNFGLSDWVLVDRAWHLVRELANGRLTTRCTAIDAAGRVLATREADEGDDGWLPAARTIAAAGPWLFVVTDDGIVRVGVAGGQLDAGASYPDTAPFVADPCELMVGADGLYVVGAREIVRLTLRA